MSKLEREIDILIELERLNSLYIHYKNLYRRLILLCCSKSRSITKFNRDSYKSKIKDKRRERKTLRALTV